MFDDHVWKSDRFSVLYYELILPCPSRRFANRHTAQMNAFLIEFINSRLIQGIVLLLELIRIQPVTLHGSQPLPARSGYCAWLAATDARAQRSLFHVSRGH